jgi:dipeptidyl aminopeptidase
MVTSNTTSPKTLVHTNQFHDFDQQDRLITDVVWATTSHTHLLFKQMNRVQDHRLTNMVTVQKNLPKSTVSVIQEYKPTDGGWIDVDQSMVYLPSQNNQVQYLDNMDSEDGYAHLGVVTVSEHKTNVHWLTSGEWEVVSGTVNVDEERKLM